MRKSYLLQYIRIQRLRQTSPPRRDLGLCQASQIKQRSRLLKPTWFSYIHNTNISINYLAIGAIAEYPATFEDITCYHDTMIRSENDDVINYITGLL